MRAKDLINYMIPPLRLEDDISKCMKWMEELRVPQLPVLSEGIFVGFLSEETIFNLDKAYEKIQDYELSAVSCIVQENQHYYDVVRLAYENHSSLVAVISENEYKGVISVQDVIEAYAKTASVNLPGGIIVISLKQIDYSLSEISRLVESEGYKILSSYVMTDLADSAIIRLTLKLNKEDLGPIDATFIRFGYKVEDQFSNKPKDGNDKERLDMLMKYLNLS
ncbi:MAG: cbs domain containing protein [Bacteroidetes bacterium]|nr:cbs domain containing protein [Bacteroidota bacterium]MDA1119262.1 cbs domain containing protein [Bacteroidota bacterium]